MGRKTNKQRREKQAVTAREKAALAKAEQRRVDQRRRALTVLSTIVVIAIAAAVVAFVAIHSTKNSPNDRAAATTALVQSVTSVSPAALQTVGKGSANLLVKPTDGDPPLTLHGKPEFLFIGGEFCPYCAAERWSIVQALSRFGAFKNLSQIRSGVSDGNLATFSFYKSSYSSKYIAFVPVENEDRNRNQLQPLTAAQTKIFQKYTNGFPFLYFGGKYVQTNAGYDPTLLSGLTQQQIAAQLKDPTSKIAQAILGEANNLTATLCKLTNNQPARACSSSTITSLQSQLGA